MNRTDSGLLVAVEGIDGAGKTTQIEFLAEFFDAAGEPFVRSKEPTDGVWGQKIRASAATGRMSLADELRAFVEDRKEHVRDVISPALADGKVVLLDRYFYSTIAYQGSRGAGVDAVADEMLRIAPEPDVVILLDAPAEVGLARISNGRGETPNRFEQLSNLRTVRETFLSLVSRFPNIVQIDGCGSQGIVRWTILRTLLDGALKKRYCAKPWGCSGLLCGDRIAGTCRWAAILQTAGDFENRLCAR